MGLTISGLSISRGSFRMGVSKLHASPGATLSVVGPSGCGKSSLLLAIAGFVPIHTGSIISPTGHSLEQIPPEKREVGILFQRAALFPHMNVLRNVEFGLMVRGQPQSIREATARRWLDRLKIQELSNRMPHSLSGGQAQRVALARIFAVGFKVLLLDEPFSSLDPPLRKEIRKLVFDLVSENQVSCIMVTHDPDDLRSAAGPVIVLEKGQVAYQGTVAEGAIEGSWLHQFLTE